jgi:hypothetical protein
VTTFLTFVTPIDFGSAEAVSRFARIVSSNSIYFLLFRFMIDVYESLLLIYAW